MAFDPGATEWGYVEQHVSNPVTCERCGLSWARWVRIGTGTAGSTSKSKWRSGGRADA